MRTAFLMLALATAAAVLPTGASAQQRAGYQLGVVVRGQNSSRVRVFVGSGKLPPGDGAAPSFDRRLNPGESAVMALPQTGAWWQYTHGTWETDWSVLSFVGLPRGGRGGANEPRIVWIEVQN